MWVEKTSTGFRLCDRYEGFDGKLHKVSVSLAKDTPQARRVAQRELQEKIMSKSSTVSEMSLNRLVGLYLSEKDIKQSTRTNYENAFKQLCSILGDIQINKLTAPYIKRKLTDSGKAPKTLNRYLALFHDFQGWCVEYGYMESILLIKSFPDKAAKRDPSLEYLEASELQNVLDQLVGSMAYYVVKFLALTGCRAGEMTALTLDDIDQKYIHITKAYHVQNGIATPKTSSSVRDIYIQPELAALLKEYKEWRLLHMMASKIRTDKLFFNQRGGWMTYECLGVRLKAVESPKHLHPHIFRHTHVALLAEQGMSLEAIARRLGHVDSNITKMIYYHVTEKVKERDENLLNCINLL